MFVHRALSNDFSRSAIQRMLKQGSITVDGQTARAADKVKPGWLVEIDPPEPEPLKLTPRPMDFEVLFEDADIIVINKPSGLVVHPSPGHADHTLVHGLLHHCHDLAGVGGKLRPGIVHRLDKDTSGALVAAKTDQAHRMLVGAFASGRVEKRYLALVHGRPPLKGKADAPIGRHPVDRKRMSTAARHGKTAHTAWQRMREYGENLSLLKVAIRTGRTHQIRVHLAEAGYPVLGDRVYGGRRARRKFDGPLGQALKQADRQMLHAVYLAFNHPTGGQRLVNWAPLPPDFRAVLAALEENK